MTHKKLLERNRKITDALQNGAKVTDLAQEHGLSPQTVYHIAQAEVNNPALTGSPVIDGACGATRKPG